MACFLVPVGGAIVTTVVRKVAEQREKKTGEARTGNTGLTWSRRLSWLNRMLWGGSALLAIEHVWHGEIIARAPFLTAMQSSQGIATMLHEMATVGVAIIAAVTVVWGIIVLIAELKAKAMVKEKRASLGESVE